MLAGRRTPGESVLQIANPINDLEVYGTPCLAPGVLDLYRCFDDAVHIRVCSQENILVDPQAFPSGLFR